jgi:hypothetical protein
VCAPILSIVDAVCSSFRNCHLPSPVYDGFTGDVDGYKKFCVVHLLFHDAATWVTAADQPYLLQADAGHTTNDESIVTTIGIRKVIL